MEHLPLLIPVAIILILGPGKVSTSQNSLLWNFKKYKNVRQMAFEDHLPNIDFILNNPVWFILKLHLSVFVCRDALK